MTTINQAYYFTIKNYMNESVSSLFLLVLYLSLWPRVYTKTRNSDLSYRPYDHGLGEGRLEGAGGGWPMVMASVNTLS